MGALGVSEAGFVAPEDVVPVGASGLDAVFGDEVPDDLLEGDAAGWEMESCEWSWERVVVGRGVHVQVAAGILSRGVSVVLVLEERLRVVQIAAGLIAIGRAQRLEARRAAIGGAIHTQGHLNVEEHPVPEWYRSAAAR